MKVYTIKKENIFNSFRFWILKMLFSENEKALITQSIESRIDELEKISVNERWADKESISDDIFQYFIIKKIFTNKYTGQYYIIYKK